MSGYGIFASYYDALTYNVDYPTMAARLCELIDRFGGDRSLVLDFACGTGSLCVELLQRGCDVIGTDASPDMLGVAREKCEALGFSPLLLCQSMQKLDLYGTVTAAVCTLDSLNHIPSLAGMQKAIARAALFLEPGGLFLFDVNTVYKHAKVLCDNTFVYDRDSVYCVWQNRLRQQHTVDIRLDLFCRENGLYRRFSEQFSERAYDPDELQAAIDAAGLTVLAQFDGYTDAPVGEKTERILYVCQKSKE